MVDVRSAGEILATLDERGALEALPFMPEMVQYLGRRFVVDKRADKICDTIHYTGSRRLREAVLLEDLRCDGLGHDGCEAECRLFWKEAWLRPVEPGGPSPDRPDSDPDRDALLRLVSGQTKQAPPAEGSSATRYRCQATELTRATRHLRTWDPRPYVRELASGNVPLGRFLRVCARAAILEPARKLGLMPDVHLMGTSAATTSSERPLDLEPGEWVQVRSREEIAATLNVKGKNRGLWFDREMLPHCGGTYRVRRRLSRFIDDRTSEMVTLKNDCLTLEGVVCSGDRSLSRWFCPRAIFPFWRECWLRRVDPQTGATPASGPGTAPPGAGGAAAE